jgi:hypothetical protein
VVSGDALIQCRPGAGQRITNSIIYNTQYNTPGPTIIDCDLFNSDVWPYQGITISAPSIALDPAFSPGSFQLSATSPCHNTGTGSGDSTIDFAGNPRLVGGVIDMGAFERQ